MDAGDWVMDWTMSDVWMCGHNNWRLQELHIWHYTQVHIILLLLCSFFTYYNLQHNSQDLHLVI